MKPGGFATARFFEVLNRILEDHRPLLSKKRLTLGSTMVTFCNTTSCNGTNQMTRNKKNQPSGLEGAVMEVVWAKGQATAETVRTELEKTQPLKDSTVRTILRRLEEKGLVEHDVEGRTYVYRPRVESHHVATDAVRGIIDRFCGGSVENLLLGMVDGKMLSTDKLKQLAKKIADAEVKEKKKGKS